MSRVSITPVCWEWTGSHDFHGYGIFWDNFTGTHIKAHNLSYAIFVDDVDRSMDRDHLCKNKGCVRPDHLEQVSHQTNTARALMKERCKRGHWLGGDNVQEFKRKDAKGNDYVGRRCRECQRITTREAARRRRGTQQDVARHEARTLSKSSP